MKRTHPWFSPLGLALTAVILGGVGFFTLRHGGESFSPGPLSAKSVPGVTLQGFASHAEFEEQCELCHQPLNANQAERCVACHEDIATQMRDHNRTHGKLQSAADCAACHQEHQGLDFDPTTSALARYDHDVTDFSLIHHQVDFEAAPMACNRCHAQDDFSVSNQSCVACHGDQHPDFIARHQVDFGPDCQACHDGQDRMRDFDHASTRLPLDGIHNQIQCVDCHRPQAFDELSPNCVSCHDEPVTHQGYFEPDCAACHNANAWVPALLDGDLFSHLDTTGFSLARHAQDYDATPLTCVACHQEDLHTFDILTCVDCHASNDLDYMEAHVVQFGLDCLACHDGVDRMHDFNHDAVFALDGRHAEADCAACHENQVFGGTPTACVECHAEPEIHVGVFGLQCHYCHDARVWAPAQLVIHPFPLDHGGEGEVECVVCHAEVYVDYTCYGCHDHQEDAIEASHLKAGIDRLQIPSCVECHASGIVEEG